MIKKIESIKPSTSTSIDKWNSSQLKNFRTASEIDECLFCPMVSDYNVKEFKETKKFTKNTAFMKHFYENWVTYKLPEPYIFKLTQMINHNYESNIVKHIFGSANNVSVSYFENVVPLPRDTSKRDLHWKRVNSFLKTIFSKQADTQGIDKMMRHQNTKCIENTHPVNENGREKTIACIVFQTLDALPYGAVIFYVALSYKIKTELLDKTLKYKISSHQLWRQGIGRKLLHMVQFISWVQVRNISIHLCATATSLQFYESLNFQKYNLIFEQLPQTLQNSFEIENIGEVGGTSKMHPMFIANHLLSSPVPSAKIIMQKYIVFLTGIPTTKTVRSRLILNTQKEQMFDDVDENVEAALKRLQLLLKEPFVFTKYYLEQYNIRKSQIVAVDESQDHMELQELHNNFINENSFINISQVTTHTMKLISEK